MVEWVSVSHISPQRGEIKRWVGKSDAVNWASVQSELISFWPRLWKTIIAQAVACEPWDTILCFVRPDSGSIYIVPAVLPYRKTIEKIEFLVSFRFIEELWFALPEDEGEFDAACTELFAQIFSVVRGSLIDASHRQLYHHAHRLNPFEVHAMQFDDVETLRRIDHLGGELQ